MYIFNIPWQQLYMKNFDVMQFIIDNLDDEMIGIHVFPVFWRVINPKQTLDDVSSDILIITEAHNEYSQPFDKRDIELVSWIYFISNSCLKALVGYEIYTTQLVLYLVHITLAISTQNPTITASLQMNNTYWTRTSPNSVHKRSFIWCKY